MIKRLKKYIKYLNCRRVKFQKSPSHVPWHPVQGSAVKMENTWEGDNPEFWTQPATELLCDFEQVP